MTPKQKQLRDVLKGPAQHIMAFGGSRSGKTFECVRLMTYRAFRCEGSRHLITRFRFNAAKQSILLDTFPQVMKKAFPDYSYKINKTDWMVELPSKSEIWIGGLDEKERTEKIL